MKTLGDLLNRDELEDILKHFSSITGLGVSLHDLDGNVLLSFREGGSCICNIIGEHPMCFDSTKFSMRKAAELGESYIYTCACGLVMNASAIMLDDNLIGAVLCGPAMLWDKNDFSVDELELNTARAELTETDMKSIIENTPKLGCSEMTSASRILFRLVNYMCKSRSDFLSQRQEITKQQATISLLLSENKENANLREGLLSPVNEKQFLTFVRLGDISNAKQLLNTILADIFLKSGGNLSIIGAKLYELTSLLYQIAFESGVPGEKLIIVARKSQDILTENITFEDLCYATTRILEEYIDSIYHSHPNISGGRYLSEATAYMNESYRKEITLVTLSEKLGISASYLSHLFKEGLNTTFIKMLTKIRTEKAKQLLIGSDMPITLISENVGYADPSYFIRAFKKTVGVTPVKYRQLNTEGLKNSNDNEQENKL